MNIGNETRKHMNRCRCCGSSVILSQYISGDFFVLCDDKDHWYDFKDEQPRTVEEAVGRWNKFKKMMFTKN